MRGRRVGVAIVLLAVLAACGGQQPAPGPPAPSTPASPVPPPGPDPSVARDVRGFVGRPCDLLTPDQARGLELRPDGAVTVGGSDTPPVGCAWFRGLGERVGDVELFPADRDLLAEAYRDFLPTPSRRLVPTSVGALPAVADGPFDGFIRCELTVRTDVGQAFTVRVQQVDLELGAACAVGRAVAESVVAALPPRA